MYILPQLMAKILQFLFDNRLFFLHIIFVRGFVRYKMCPSSLYIILRWFARVLHAVNTWFARGLTGS